MPIHEIYSTYFALRNKTEQVEWVNSNLREIVQIDSNERKFEFWKCCRNGKIQTK